MTAIKLTAAAKLWEMREEITNLLEEGFKPYTSDADTVAFFERTIALINKIKELENE